MNSNLKEIDEEIQTKSRRPPQVKFSKAQIHAKFHKIPAIRFEDQKLTSFSGLLIFQALLTRMNLMQRLKKCFNYVKVSSIFGDAKGNCGLNVIPTLRLAGNQVYTLCSMMAHNLSREIQRLLE